MDRNRPIQKRSAKGKAPPPGDFIALGSKPRSDSDVKLSSSSGQARKPGGMGIKRDSPSGPPLLPPKKLIKPLGQTFTPLGRPGDMAGRGSPTIQICMYDEIAAEVTPKTFLDAVNEAEDNKDNEKIESLLCGAVKYLKMNRAKPEPAMYLSLMYLAKARPSFFIDIDVVIEAFSSLLKRDLTLNFKSKGNPLVSVLACNVLTAAFQDEENWPDAFVKVYLEDSLGERVWVDRQDCKAFVQNIQSAFNTKLPPATLLQDSVRAEQAQTASASASPAHSVNSACDDEDSQKPEAMEMLYKIPDEEIAAMIFPRYTYQHVSIESYVMEMVKDHLSRRQAMDSASRNMLRLLTASCGYSEIRMLVVPRLEMWLQNPKLTKSAQDLLLSVCMNCDQHSQSDVEVMSHLCKMRLKTKPLITHYMLCMRELLTQHQENARTLMHHIIYNELSSSKNPNNMTLLSVMFQQDSTRAAWTLAEIFQNLLSNKDDYLRALRGLLREITRHVRQDMNSVEFVRGLTQERVDSKIRDMEPLIKERFLHALTDLVCLTSLLSVSSSVREAASVVSRADARELEVLKTFQSNISTMQRDSVAWLHNVVPKMYTVKPAEYAHCLKKVLFMEKIEHYHRVDNWPPESDRSVMLRLVSEVPVIEDTLMWVLLMGLSRDHHVNPSDAIDLADQLVRRAASLHPDNSPVLHMKRLEIVDVVLNLCAYRHPENIALPKGYQPPSLAISNLYWKAWIILLVISAFNPSTFGMACWKNYPILKCLMEMTMTNNFKFPPPTMITADSTADEIKAQEKQIAELEKQAILEFESHLAAASSKVQITESNSLLINELTAMDPSGVVRRPPMYILDQLKSLNYAVHLGHHLCRSRNPDFLLDVIQRQGTSQSMPWLADLVESSDSSLDVLPVQCLCEFLLHDTLEGSLEEDDDDDGKMDKNTQKLKQRKQRQVLLRLQRLLYDPTSDQRSVEEVLTYFLKRLVSQQASNRKLAIKGLSLVLVKNPDDEDDDDDKMEDESDTLLEIFAGFEWLLQHLPALPLFDAVRSQACSTVRKACQVDTDAMAVGAYIVFLSRHTKQLQLQDLDELAVDIAQLIVGRGTLMNHLLPQDGEGLNPCSDYVLCALIDLFHTYLRKAQQPENETFSWSNTQDQVLLKWETGESATMNILVVHSMIILLTYGRPKVTSHFDSLLDAWFSPNNTIPCAYLVDTSEEALLFPDWLKLRMIRSTIDRLVDAALMDLEPSQLILFVQSFGIPVRSMSKLLHCLDEAVDLDSLAMQQVVVDKSYMAQLVEVQHMRGATGGQRFKEILTHGQDLTKKDSGGPWPARRQRRATSQLTRTPQIPPQQQDGQQHIRQLLITAFGLEGSDPSITAAEKQQAFRLIQQGLNRPAVTATLLTVLMQLLSGGSAKDTVTGLKKHLHHSCPLLRMLFSKQFQFGGTILELTEKLHGALGESKSALASLAQDYLRKQLPRSPPGRSVGQPLQALQHAVEDAKHKHSPVAERDINCSIAESCQQDASRQTAHALCSILTSPQGDSMLQSTAGLLVDWLELLDPEMLHACPELQQQLLFAKELKHSEGRDNVPRQASTQPYLLALLTHQGSWQCIQRCIGLLLTEDSVERFDSSSTLDFLWACIHIPKIWQGRDKAKPKNALLEDVLHLSPAQLCCVADYILLEAKKQNVSGTSHQSEKVISQRMRLLLHCCCHKHHLVMALVTHLLDVLRKNGDSMSICRQLLLEVYLQMPQILTLSSDISQVVRDVHSLHNTPSQLDIVTHRVLTTLSNTGAGKAKGSKLYDANIACRKLASEHPLLVLRQLPMVATLLQGRVHFHLQELKDRNYLLLYTHVLGLLEFLQPHVFALEYSSSLQLVLTSYFELVKVHGLSSKHLSSVVTKFIQFLHNFLTHDSVRASQILHQYIPLLNELTHQYSEYTVLRSLLAGLTLPVQGKAESDQDTSEPSSHQETGGASLVPTRPGSPYAATQLAPFLQRISKGSSTEDVIEVLKDLDETSKRKVDILQYFLEDLRRLMCHSNSTCRETAFNIVMRLVRHNPSCASEVVPTFLHCLGSSDKDITKTALRSLAEFTLLAQEHASCLLYKAFSIGVHCKVDTGTHITEALNLLNLETIL